MLPLPGALCGRPLSRWRSITSTRRVRRHSGSGQHPISKAPPPQAPETALGRACRVCARLQVGVSHKRPLQTLLMPAGAKKWVLSQAAQGKAGRARKHGPRASRGRGCRLATSTIRPSRRPRPEQFRQKQLWKQQSTLSSRESHSSVTPFEIRRHVGTYMNLDMNLNSATVGQSRAAARNLRARRCFVLVLPCSCIRPAVDN